MSVTPQQVVDAARMLNGAPYRRWYDGAALPMWWDDGFSWHGKADCPPVSYARQYGVMCADLINWALQYNDLPAVGGTAAWAEAVEDWEYFDPYTPGAPGHIAVKGYGDVWNQGHVVLYTGEHSIIQGINYPGVTEAYTDTETYQWQDCDFQYYGKIPGVDYGSAVEDPVPATGQFDVEMLIRAMTSNTFAGPDITRENAQRYFAPLVKACKKYRITDRARLSAFLAQTGAESGSYYYWEEIEGAGQRYAPFFGRGPIQLTWRENYQAYSDATGVDIVSNPDLVADDPEIGFDVAGWYWQAHGLNQLASQATWDSYIQITGRIWGAAVAVAERDNRYSHAWDALPADLDLTAVVDPEPEQPGVVVPQWVAIDGEGWLRANGQDWSRGWWQVRSDGSVGQWLGE